jgi:beta-alanine--pyruvate transaminase
MTMAKGINNAAVPMGAVAVRPRRSTTPSSTPPLPNSIELFHGYTYSAHPLAAAATMAALELYQREAAVRARPLALAARSRRRRTRCALPHVRDIRNLGLVAGHRARAARRPNPAARAYEVFLRCLERGVLIRYTADIAGFLAAADRRAGADRADLRHGRRGAAEHPG